MTQLKVQLNLTKRITIMLIINSNQTISCKSPLNKITTVSLVTIKNLPILKTQTVKVVRVIRQ